MEERTGRGDRLEARLLVYTGPNYYICRWPALTKGEKTHHQPHPSGEWQNNAALCSSHTSQLNQVQSHSFAYTSLHVRVISMQ